MGRRPKEREIAYLPQLTLFVPAVGGDRLSSHEDGTVRLGLDELEALRLAHIEDLDQATAAAALGISRPTFGRILSSAHRKAALALVEGKPLTISGGQVVLEAGPRICERCGLVMPGDRMTGPDFEACPACSGHTRRLEAEELPDLTMDRLRLLGERLSLDQKRVYLQEAIHLSQRRRRRYG